MSAIRGLAPVDTKPTQPYCEVTKDKRPFGLQSAPTMYPSEEEFKDPHKYIKSLVELGRKYGILKIVPPANWNPRFSLDIGVRLLNT
jgi:[histone H3]-trimethyl-L-lysine4 demethylase